MAQLSFQAINLTADLTLLWPSSFETQGTKLTDVNNITAVSMVDLKIIMPNATLVPPGQYVLFNNLSATTFQIVASDTTTIIATVTGGQAYQIYLNSNQTAVGGWNAIPAGGGTSNINSVTALSSNNSLVIANSPLTPPGGVLDFSLTPSMFNLNTVSTIGFTVITSTAPLTWRTASLAGGTNITVTNSNGIAGNPIISLNNSLVGISSATIGDMIINNSVITTNLDDGSIQIASEGAGQVIINGVSIDGNSNIRGINNLLGFRAFAMFTDTIVGISNVIAIPDKINVASITGSHGSYTVTFTTAMPNVNYGVLLTTFTPGGNPPPVTHAMVSARTLTTMTIQVVDASGEMALAIPSGMTFAILSSSF